MILDSQEQKDILLQVLENTQFTVTGTGMAEFSEKYCALVETLRDAEVGDAPDADEGDKQLSLLD